jgi:hypothetical protein
MPQFFTMKVVVLLALLVEEDYPIGWACLLDNILEALDLCGGVGDGGGTDDRPNG